MKRRIAASHTSVMDFAITCDCGNVATTYLEIHSFGLCDKDPTTGQFFCDGCFKMSMARVQDIVDEGDADCDVCARKVITLSDIVVRIQPLEGKKGEGSR